MTRDCRRELALPGRAYSRDEWILLYEYYTTHETPEQDDANPVLRAFANELGRSPSSVDKSLRNIRAYCEGPGLANNAAMMKEVVDQYKGNPSALKRAASDIRQKLPR